MSGIYCCRILRKMSNLNMLIWHILLLSCSCSHIIPLPGDLLWVRAAGAGEHAPQGGGGQLLGHLPHPALRVMRKQHQPRVPVQVERRQQPPVWPLLPGEGAREVSHLGRDSGIDIDCVIHFVLWAGAFLEWGEVLLVTLEPATKKLVILKVLRLRCSSFLNKTLLKLSHKGIILSFDRHYEFISLWILECSLYEIQICFIF